MELTEPIPVQIHSDEVTPLAIGAGIDVTDPQMAAFIERHKDDGHRLGLILAGRRRRVMGMRVDPDGADRAAIRQLIARCFPGAEPQQCTVLLLMPGSLHEVATWTFLVTYQGQTFLTVLPEDPPLIRIGG